MNDWGTISKVVADSGCWLIIRQRFLPRISNLNLWGRWSEDRAAEETLRNESGHKLPEHWWRAHQVFQPSWKRLGRAYHLLHITDSASDVIGISPPCLFLDLVAEIGAGTNDAPEERINTDVKIRVETATAKALYCEQFKTKRCLTPVRMARHGQRQANN